MIKADDISSSGQLPPPRPTETPQGRPLVFVLCTFLISVLKTTIAAYIHNGIQFIRFQSSIVITKPEAVAPLALLKKTYIRTRRFVEQLFKRPRKAR